MSYPGLPPNYGPRPPYLGSNYLMPFQSPGTTFAGHANPYDLLSNAVGGYLPSALPRTVMQVQHPSTPAQWIPLMDPNGAVVGFVSPTPVANPTTPFAGPKPLLESLTYTPAATAPPPKQPSGSPAKDLTTQLSAEAPATAALSSTATITAHSKPPSPPSSGVGVAGSPLDEGGGTLPSFAGTTTPPSATTRETPLAAHPYSSASNAAPLAGEGHAPSSASGLPAKVETLSSSDLFVMICAALPHMDSTAAAAVRELMGRHQSISPEFNHLTGTRTLTSGAPVCLLHKRVIDKLTVANPPSKASSNQASSSSPTPRLTDFKHSSVRSFMEALVLRWTLGQLGPEGLPHLYAWVDKSLYSEVERLAYTLFGEKLKIGDGTLDWPRLVAAIFAVAVERTPEAIDVLLKSSGITWSRGSTSEDTFVNLAAVHASLEELFDFLPVSGMEHQRITSCFFRIIPSDTALRDSCYELLYRHFATHHLAEDFDSLTTYLRFLETLRSPQVRLNHHVQDSDTRFSRAKLPAQGAPTAQTTTSPAGARLSASRQQRGRSTQPTAETRTAPAHAHAAAGAFTPTAARGLRPPPKPGPCDNCTNPYHHRSVCRKEGGGNATQCRTCGNWGHDATRCKGDKPPPPHKKGTVTVKLVSALDPLHAAALEEDISSEVADIEANLPPHLPFPGSKAPKYSFFGDIGGSTHVLSMDTQAGVSCMRWSTFKRIKANCDRLRIPYKLNEGQQPIQNPSGEVTHYTTVTLTVTYRLHARVSPDLPFTSSKPLSDNITFTLLDDNTQWKHIRDSILLGSDVIRAVCDREGKPNASEIVTDACFTGVDAITLRDHTGVRYLSNVKPPLGADGKAFVTEVVEVVSEADPPEEPLNTAELPSADPPPPLSADSLREKISNVTRSFGAKVSDALFAALLAAAELQGPFVKTPVLPAFSIQQIDPNLRILDGFRQQFPDNETRPALVKELRSLIERGVLRTCKPSDLTNCHRMVVVPKADNRVRIALDLRRQNQNTVKHKTVLPNVKDFPTHFIGCVVFSKADFKDAFFQFPCAEDTIPLLGIRLPPGLGSDYACFMRAPQGASNVPGLCQDYLTKRVMASFVAKSSGRTVIEGLLDDVVIGTRSASGSIPVPGSAEERETAETHIKDLIVLFSILQEDGIRVASNFGKCEFVTRVVTAVGLQFDGTVVRTDPARIKDLSSLLVPPNPTIEYLRQVIGFYNYHTEAVNKVEYLERLHFLNKLLADAQRGASVEGKKKKANLVRSLWTTEATAAVNYLRDAVVSAADRYIPDLNKPFYVYCDASDVGWAVHVVQQHNGTEHLVMVLCKPFTSTQLALKVAQKEALAVVAFVRAVGTQLRIWNWTLRTDHANLLVWQSSVDPLLRRWYLELCHVCDKVQHIAGASNIVADGLSRYPRWKPQPLLPLPTIPVVEGPHSPGVGSDLSAVTVLAVKAVKGKGPQQSQAKTQANSTTPTTPASTSGDHVGSPISAIPLIELIGEAQAASPWLKERLDSGDSRFSIIPIDDTGTTLVWAGSRRVIPPDAKDLIRLIMRLAHDASGHTGMDKTEAKLGGFYLPDKTSIVREYVASCSACQHAKDDKTHSPVGTSSPRAFVAFLECVLMDYQGPFVTARNGDQYVLTMTDALSRFTWVRTYPTADVANSIDALKSLIDTADRPYTIQVDAGSHFLGEFPSFCQQQGILLHVTHAQHAQSNGKAERFHRTLLEKLRTALTPATDASWLAKLPATVSAINKTVNRSLGFSPHELVYGASPRGLLEASLKEPPVNISPTLRTQHLSALRELAAEHSAASAVLTKRALDSKARAVPKYQPGDHVLIHHDNRANKLHSHYRDLSVIISVDPGNPNFYVVGRLDHTGQPSNPVSIAADRLRRFNASRTTSGQEELRVAGPDHYVVEAIVGHRVRPSYPDEYDYLVKWEGYEEISGAVLEDLRKLPLFRAYIEQHNISNAHVRRQIKNERLRSE